MSKVPSVGFAGMNDLFGLSGNVSEVMEIALSECHPFKNHPFKVLDDDDMQNLVESVKLNGKILEPILVRPAGIGNYEIISGHRRCEAARRCGFDKIPAIVHDYTDDEATVIMVDANLRRENLSYSEMAYAYRMKYDAMKHQGKMGEGSSLEALAENSNDSAKKIQRLIRLTYLIPQLLELIDTGNIPFLAGVDLAALETNEQMTVYTVLICKPVMKIDIKQAKQLKDLSSKGIVSEKSVRDILLPEKKPPVKKFTWKSDRIYEYFSPEKDSKEIEDTILRLLEKYRDEL